jgi:hypothetical protein
MGKERLAHKGMKVDIAGLRQPLLRVIIEIRRSLSGVDFVLSVFICGQK